MADCNYSDRRGSDDHETCGNNGHYCGNDCPKLK